MPDLFDGQLLGGFLLALGNVDADGLFAADDLQFGSQGLDPPQAVFDLGGHRVLADGDAGARRVEQADRFVGQLPGRDVAVRELDGRLRSPRRAPARGGASPASRPCRRIMRIAFSSLGSPTCTTWNRRVRAGSFSMCFLYSAQVVAAIVRSLPRARAGLSRLAASPVPAAPPAPISVWASSMNRMIGLGDACTSSMTCFRRFSNSPFMLAPACSRPTSSDQQRHVLEHRRHVAAGDAGGKAFDDGRFADARLAGEDRVVLPAAHEDIDELADFLVAADDRIELALFGPLGPVDGELLERLLLAHLSRRHRAAGFARRRAAQVAAVVGPQRVLGRAAADLRRTCPSARRR